MSGFEFVGEHTMLRGAFAADGAVNLILTRREGKANHIVRVTREHFDALCATLETTSSALFFLSGLEVNVWASPDGRLAMARAY